MADASDEAAALADGIVRGDRRALARAITLVESERDEDSARVDELFALLGAPAGEALRLGITGPPGAGKSMLIDALGRLLIRLGERVAVLAVDPSSPLGGGSILGDKTRMGRLGSEAASFIRPSPSRGGVGGIGAHTGEAVLLCEAAGYSVVVVETLGTGQGEYGVAELCDVLVLVLLAGAGDEVQGMKRGAIELADVVVLNKADGEGLAAAERAASELEGALGLFARATGQAATRVLRVSALEERGLGELWSAIQAAALSARASGALAARRAATGKQAFLSAVERAVQRELAGPELGQERERLEREVLAGRLGPRAAAKALVTRWRDG
jgi:LAO/AO transport system kinase